MTTLTFPGDPPVDIQLRRSVRARRLSLRVSRLKGSVTLTMPKMAAEAEAVAFATEKLDWIRGHLADLVPETVVEIGAHLPVEGTPRLITRGEGPRLHLTSDAIMVPARIRAVPARVGGYLRELARDRLAAASDRHAAAVQRSYTRLVLRDTRSRWGSCSSDGRLMYSWRLILAPPDVLDYVAAHEVAHLVEMNHSARFWAVVDRLCPDYKAPRAWLRANGEDLHRYRFAG
ncbi:M48 family metallopeptidase [Actibacterium sp. 188UL27-1]|uniref:M48 family metallopeptidase n=1 Tax=Actibacterium sp. 188UL27-1 TaxID=2786961 RepID=UPI001956EA6E|nr:SprT family zinc-dependent metalloprotease [Actibacterium sp. 188UL27-1]MBM7068343.1 M48 family metallopeptidase [Actibacterium sp. 188UL27-1]